MIAEADILIAMPDTRRQDALTPGLWPRDVVFVIAELPACVCACKLPVDGDAVTVHFSDSRAMKSDNYGACLA